MTDRRSGQQDAARASRAFQFVPGHVGGRVASAQPVRRRATIGAAARSQATAAPTSARIRVLTLPSVISARPDDPTMATVLYSGQGGDTAAPDAPAGWSRLGVGTYMGTCPWAVYATTDIAAAASFTSPSLSVLATYYYGGDRGAGAWGLSVGPEFGYADEKIGAAAPPSSATVWQQFAVTRVLSYINPIAGRSFSLALANDHYACRPAPVLTANHFTGADFTDHWARNPYTSPPEWTYYHAGAYGRTGSQALCVGWTP